MPNFESTSKGIQVTGIRTLDNKPAKGLMHLSFNTDDSQKNLYAAYVTGEIHDLVVRPEMLKDFSIDIEGIRFLNLEEMEELQLKREPTIHIFDLSFPGHNLEFEGLKASVLKGRHAIIKFQIHNLDIIIKLKLDDSQQPNVGLEIIRNSVHTSVKVALEAYQFVEYFFAQKPFTVHFSNGKSSTSHSLVLNKTYVKEAKAYLDYFKLMKKVENHFGVRFRNIMDLTDDSLKKLEKLGRIADGKPFELATGAMKLTMSAITKENLELYERLKEKDTPLDIQFKTTESIKIHGENIVLNNQRIHVPSAQILNLSELKKGKTKIIKLSSKQDIIYTYYHEEFGNFTNG